MLSRRFATLLAAFGSLAFAGSMVAPGEARADVTYSDSTFVGYQTGFATTMAGTSFSASQCTSCGNPNFGLHLVINDNTGAQFAAAVINPLFVYDPAVQGAISSISATVDKNFSVMSPINTYGNTFRLVIAQGGSFYTAVVFGTSLGASAGTTVSTGYAPFSLTNLAATDFNKFDTSTGIVGTDHPSFTSGLITFGIGQLLAANSFTVGSQVTVTSDFDNLKINVLSAVPEPATWGMMVLGVGATGIALRRRRAERGAARALSGR